MTRIGIGSINRIQPYLFGILLIISVFCCDIAVAQSDDDEGDFKDFPTGLILDTKEDQIYESKPRRARYDSERFTELPLKVDLKPYCPMVGNQGEINSCVGWATGYGALTIQQAIENGWTDKRMITKNAHSALFVYNQIKVGDCAGGSRISDAIELLSSKGDCYARDFDRDVNNCQRNPESTIQEYAKKYKVSDYMTLFESEAEPKLKVLRVKESLAQGKPVIIGLNIRKNFARLRRGSKFWWPDLGNTTPMGGHAMVVVGYDEAEGAFEVMNSWGKDWADDGFVRIKYKYFANNCKYAYQLFLKPASQTKVKTFQDYVVKNDIEDVDIPVLAPEPLTEDEAVEYEAVVADFEEQQTPSNTSEGDMVSEEVSLEEVFDADEIVEVDPFEEIVPEAIPISLSGSFEFKYLAGFNRNVPIFNTAEAYLDGMHYELKKQDWEVGQSFQIYASNEIQDMYVYIFSIDAQNMSHIHWPRQEALNSKFAGINESALITVSGAEIVIPNKNTALGIANPGADHLCVLFSAERINNLPFIIENIKNSSGDMAYRLQTVLRDRLIPSSDIQYGAETIHFDSNSTSGGTIVPLVLRVVAEDW
ncbi:MAG: C1 family peptidase [Chitinophagales bacterium]